ncbi:hypothetical protein F2981_00690 [Sinorhizobium meliloti]|nr:hypothetical protein [Sinorhizobium meliloti]
MTAPPVGGNGSHPHAGGGRAKLVGVVKTEADSRRLLEATPDGHARAIVADLAHASTLTERLEAEIAAHGPVYGVVNNAAVYPKART